MEEQLISFKVANLAKDKGLFENEVIEYYSEDYKEESCSGVRSFPKCTQSLLQKWLRDKHNIFVEPSLNFTSDDYPLWYNCGVMSNIKDIDSFKWHGVECSYSFYETYEEALEVGLYEALKLL